MGNQEQSAEEVFGAAFELAPNQRSVYLERACRESPELRRLVDDLLADHALLGGFLETPALGERPQTAEQMRNAATLATDTLVPRTPTPHTLAAGSRLGRYTILEPLGSGGMGVVYRAQDERLQRVVAIKLLSPGLLSGEQARLRFQKEALALAKLTQAHIAAIYDVGEQDGVDYLVMECVRGETLAARLAAGPMTVQEATSVLRQIAEALEDAHEQGVIHRDLKPANVIITAKGQVKVLDFGIAKLLAAPGDVVATETGILAGTPCYMSPEQARGVTVDARTDLWSLGVMYYELLAGHLPFRGDGSLAVLNAILDDSPEPIGRLRAELPPLCERIAMRLLKKDRDQRYASAAEVVREADEVLTSLSGLTMAEPAPFRPATRSYLFAAVVVLLTVVTGSWLYHGWSRRQWARNEGIPQVRSLLQQQQSLAAFLLMEDAGRYLPQDEQLKQLLKENSISTTITSTPTGAKVEIADYGATPPKWHDLGVTPLKNVVVANGYFRWRVTQPGHASVILAPSTDRIMNFDLSAIEKAPPGMVPVPALDDWRGSVAVIGWLGPYKLPAFFADRYEVTNREYQKFVDAGGYEKKQYWTEPFVEDGKSIAWADAVARFRDTTNRPGPSTWVAGRYPKDRSDDPVAGVSWYEASAYAAFAGKSLPVLTQWYELAQEDFAQYTVAASNISSNALAPVGAYQGVGPYGTYDMAGNVREWVANPVEGDQRYILGGAWNSPSYLYINPEALSASDRSPENGLRCVRNEGPVPATAKSQIIPRARDFASYKPATDDVFRAYKLLYNYPKQQPLNAKSEGIVDETEDWREEKVSFDAAYRGERMSAYLFLPKRVQAPFQTVLFSPSARVLFSNGSDNGRALGDLQFIDYVIQSGRAVMYPIYEETYERRINFYLPSASEDVEITIDHYKDAARSLDYLATRRDIDGSRIAYLGVSMGSAQGIISGELLQDRLKTIVMLDGGYFLDQPPVGADHADFAPRIKIPVLMVNGRYDFTFPLVKSQDPLFRMLGTPEQDKSHIVLESPHDVSEQRPLLSQAVLPWLDKYLGRVQLQAGTP